MDLLQHSVPMSIDQMCKLREDLSTFQWLSPANNQRSLIKILDEAIATARQKEAEYVEACHGMAEAIASQGEW